MFFRQLAQGCDQLYIYIYRVCSGAALRVGDQLCSGAALCVGDGAHMTTSLEKNNYILKKKIIQY